jgi:hypothetical protein
VRKGQRKSGGRPTEQTAVCLKIEIKLGGMRNVAVDDSASLAISAAVRVARAHREET